MNPDLYERYMAKKAKKLGISVEELKAQGTPSPVSETQPFTPPQAPAQDAQVAVGQEVKPISYNGYQQQTIQQHLEEQPYQPLQPQPEKVEVPSYVFGPSNMRETTSPRPLRERIVGIVRSAFAEQNTQTRLTPTTKQREQFYEQSELQMLERGVNVESSQVQINDTRENKFGLIGYPLGHSLSKVIHEAGFKSLGIDATYDILETPPDDLVDRIKWLKSNGYKGFNVTIPLKLPISLFVNEVDNYADLARAVNTVYIEPDKSLKAYNTDVIGFKRAIPYDILLRGKKVAILGTGGAAHAACVALTELGVKEIAFFTRNIPNSIELMNYLRRKFPSIEFNVYQIENIRNLEEFSMLVNTTPIGMLGKAGDMSPVEIRALQTLNSDAVVYDVIYNPKKTVLIKSAEKLGLRTITGLDMLIYQAVAAQELWFNGRRPDFKDMKIAALEAL